MIRFITIYFVADLCHYIVDLIFMKDQQFLYYLNFFSPNKSNVT